MSESMLPRYIKGDGQSDVQRRLARGEPPSSPQTRIVAIGHKIDAFDRAMGTSAMQSEHMIESKKSARVSQGENMFKDLDKIAKRVENIGVRERECSAYA